jgi:hypothetical protein
VRFSLTEDLLMGDSSPDFCGDEPDDRTSG